MCARCKVIVYHQNTSLRARISIPKVVRSGCTSVQRNKIELNSLIYCRCALLRPIMKRHEQDSGFKVDGTIPERRFRRTPVEQASLGASAIEPLKPLLVVPASPSCPKVAETVFVAMCGQVGKENFVPKEKPV